MREGIILWRLRRYSEKNNRSETYQIANCRLGKKIKKIKELKNLRYFHQWKTFSSRELLKRSSFHLIMKNIQEQKTALSKLSSRNLTNKTSREIGILIKQIKQADNCTQLQTFAIHLVLKIIQYLNQEKETRQITKMKRLFTSKK